jgi:hypothetical protein
VTAREAILWLITTDEEWLETFRLVCRHSPFTYAPKSDSYEMSLGTGTKI